MKGTYRGADKGLKKELRINRRIRGPKEVMLIGKDGEPLGNKPLLEAIMMAEEDELDLVEVAPNENPPVCKILDYGKFKYRQSKKAHDAKKKQKVIHVKEVKLRPKTEEHDFQFKLKHIKRFLEDGDKAKVTVVFRGREMVHKHIGQAILERISTELVEEVIVEQLPRQEGRNMVMVLAPKSSNK
jgi:translation initiation factor IF-3